MVSVIQNGLCSLSIVSMESRIGESTDCSDVIDIDLMSLEAIRWSL